MLLPVVPDGSRSVILTRLSGSGTIPGFTPGCTSASPLPVSCETSVVLSSTAPVLHARPLKPAACAAL